MAGLTRWDPFADMAALQSQMSRFFDDRLGWSWNQGGDNLARFSPAVDIYEDAEGITVTAELAGVDPADVEVKVEDGNLTISGTRRLEREDKKENYHRVERSYGSFYRAFSLPPTVDVDRIRAENKNGVLKLFLPHREESKPRKITIDVKH